VLNAVAPPAIAGPPLPKLLLLSIPAFAPITAAAAASPAAAAAAASPAAAAAAATQTLCHTQHAAKPGAHRMAADSAPHAGFKAGSGSGGVRTPSTFALLRQVAATWQVWWLAGMNVIKGVCYTVERWQQQQQPRLYLRDIHSRLRWN
jgi:hypothetical protein